MQEELGVAVKGKLSEQEDPEFEPWEGMPVGAPPSH